MKKQIRILSVILGACVTAVSCSKIDKEVLGSWILTGYETHYADGTEAPKSVYTEEIFEDHYGDAYVFYSDWTAVINSSIGIGYSAMYSYSMKNGVITMHQDYDTEGLNDFHIRKNDGKLIVYDKVFTSLDGGPCSPDNEDTIWLWYILEKE